MNYGFKTLLLLKTIIENKLKAMQVLETEIIIVELLFLSSLCT